MEDTMTVRGTNLKHKPRWKPNVIFSLIRALFSLSIVLSLVACTSFISSHNAVSSAATQNSAAAASVKLAATSLMFNAEADAQVNEANPTTNAGNSTYLQVDGASDPEVESFIRFTVVGASG